MHGHAIHSISIFYVLSPRIFNCHPAPPVASLSRHPMWLVQLAPHFYRYRSPARGCCNYGGVGSLEWMTDLPPFGTGSFFYDRGLG